GSGSDERDAGLAGDAAPAVGGVRRRLLVPHVDDADALVDAPVVDRHDVTAAEREHELDALFGEGARDDLSTMKLCHSEVPSRCLPLCQWLICAANLTGKLGGRDATRVC